MKKLRYQITLFVLTQLTICTSITLWIIWYVYEKQSQQTFMELAQKAYKNLEVNDQGYSGMVIGIIILTSILFLSTMIFIELIRSRTQIKQGMSLSSAFTHELITPLTCISMNLESLIQIKDLPEDNKKYLLKAAFKESKKLQNSIDKIIETKKMEYSKQNLTFKNISANNFFNKIYQESIDQYPDATINFNSDLKEDHSLKIDQKYFTMVIFNLIENGIKYSGKNPELDIFLSEQKKKIYIEIKDKGIGIHPKKLKKIFNVFYRINKNIRGNGIGLFIVKNIIKMHKGKIFAHSEGPNLGTKFTIILPINDLGINTYE